MIEFAPNPTGPAHLGTLRTYAAAFLEAREKHQPLFLRIDAWDYPAPECRAWPDTFLQQLRELSLSPDHWQYCDSAPSVPRVPEWAVLTGNLRQLWACYPVTIDAVTLDDRPEMWQLGQEPPRRQVGPEPQDSYHYTRFARWRQREKEYVLIGALASLVSMTLRGTKTIVRSHASTSLRQFNETFAAEWFGFRLPEVRYTAYVISEEGGLGKSQLGKSQLHGSAPGTVAWAMETYGADHVRESIIQSVREDMRKLIPYQEILA